MSGVKKLFNSLSQADSDKAKANADATSEILKSVDTNSSAALALKLINANPLMRKILGDD